jgi:aryl-alcohol dehydrogenase-like predicted oxidoreductase
LIHARTLDTLYLGISDTPAWQVSRMQAVADLRGWSPLVALQIEYSLIQRTVERDLIPMAREMGLGVIPWSPLASGVLSGKYTRADLDVDGSDALPTGTRKNIAAGNGSLTERGLAIADAVQGVARETGASPSQVAIAWIWFRVPRLARRPGSPSAGPNCRSRPAR